MFPRVAGPAALCLLAAGCATQQQTAALECGAGGAAAGYLLCKALGRSDRDCAGFAAAGGGAGGALCYGYAANLQKRRQQLAGRENDLDAQLQYVRALNDDGQRLNAQLRERIDAARKRAQELSAQAGRNRPPAAELARERERQRLDGEIKEASQQIELQKGALEEVRTLQARRRAESPALDGEIAKQDRLLAEARGQLATMTSLRERV
jgi:F0F1-type ATP synthase membrane subunit b/b'